MSTTVKPKTKHKPHRGTGALTAVDYALLEILPDEGQMMGYHPIALPVGSLKERPEFEGFTGNQIGGRLKSMSYQGYTTAQVVLPVQRGLGWQRTAKGKELLKRNGKGV